MTTIDPGESICSACRLLRRTDNPDHDPSPGSSTESLIKFCAAFPDWIPDDIRAPGAFDHRLPYPGDHGIRFELNPEKESLLPGFEQRAPVEVARRDVTESARQWAVKLAALRGRQLARLGSLADAPELAIPVWTDGSPALLKMGDAMWLIVSTKGPQDLDWSFHEAFRGWITLGFEDLAARLDDEVMLYIDEGGPLVPAGKLKPVSLELLRAARRHRRGPEPAEVFSNSQVHYRQEDAAAGETPLPVFTSPLGAWAHFGETPTVSSRSQDLARVAGTGRTFLLDPGQPHSLEIHP